MAVQAEAEPDLWREQQRFYNFLQHYDLHKYHRKFLATGVSKISHLKAVDDQSLSDIGLTRPERIRLRKKLEENFSVGGKLRKSLTGKANRFDQPAPEQAHKKDNDVSAYHTASLIAKEEVQIGKKIGEGAHGSVHEGTWANVHGSVTVAVKTLYGKQDVQAQFIKEADSMRALNHPHIIRLYGIVLSAPLMLVEELAPFGNLLRSLQQNGPTLNLHTLHTYACQIADAMKYLESRRVVHRDLAARNILLAAEDFIKLSDFGMARILDEYSDVYNLSNLQDRIPIAWTALEALTHAKFSTASDVWSYGVTLWEIYALGKTPWEGLSPIDVRDNLARGERLGRPERCPSEVFRLILSCWEKNPRDRPNFATICGRIEAMPPRKVRAHKGHNVEADDKSLNFRAGDIIYIIDRPKPEWIFGMKATGETGHFLADHVSDELEPLTDLKELVQSGRAKASELPISGPTSVSHEYHWGRDGKKWVAGEATSSPGLAGQMRSGARISQLYEGGGSNHSNSSESSRESVRSPLSPPSKSPVYNVPRPTSRSPSPLTSSQSHAAVRRSGSDSSSRHSSTRSPEKLLPISQITYGDATFLGRQRYIPNAASFQRPKQQEERVESQLHDLDIESQQERTRMSRQNSEDDQYVPIFSRSDRSSFLEDIPDGRELQPQQSLGFEGPENDGYDYLKMSPAPTRLHAIHGNQNLSTSNGTVAQLRKTSLDCIGEFREEVPAYAVSSVRDQVRSSSSSASESQRSTPSFVQSPIPELSSNPLEYTTGVDASLLAEPLVPSLSPPPKGEGNPYVLEPSSLPQLGTNNSFGPQSRSSQSPSTNPFLPRGSDAHDQSFFSQSSSAGSRSYSYAGGEHRIGFASQKSQSFDAQPMTTAPTAVVNRSSSFQSGQGGSPRQRLHGYDKIPTPQIESRTLAGMDLRTSTAVSPPAASQGLEAILLAEFPNISPELCKQALECARYNMQRAREEVQIQLLLQMGMTFITADDCRRALSHCQWKLDRAASWLLEQSTDITTRIS